MESSELKVLILIGGTRVIGPVKGVLQLLENLKSLSVDCICVNSIDPEAETKEINEASKEYGLQIHECRVIPRNYFSYVSKLKQIVTEQKISVIQTHGYKESFAGFMLKLVTGVKWICFMHGRTTENFKVQIYNQLDNLMQTYSDRTILVADRQRISLIGGNNQDKVITIPNAIDKARARKKADALILPHETDRHVENLQVVVVGRLSPEKGVDLFLEALSIVQKKLFRIKALIIGDGPEEKNLIDRCAQLKLNESLVEFLGYLKNPLPYIKSSDCLVVPSRSEGCPNVVLEAMALGKAVIATDVGGVPDLVEQNETGIIVPPGKPRELASAMIKAYENREMLTRMGERAYLTVNNRHSPIERAKRIKKIYHQVFGET